VVLNLLKNAAQAMHNFEAEPKEPCITLRTMREDDMVRIEVEDNGAGMPDEVRRRIFEPFFTTKGVGIGTGLGLSVSYFIITENHGGSMEVRSKPGRGTTFIIRLPLVKRGK
jgi:polar amino acid transport system substrate-binding protein